MSNQDQPSVNVTVDPVVPLQDRFAQLVGALQAQLVIASHQIDQLTAEKNALIKRVSELENPVELPRQSAVRKADH